MQHTYSYKNFRSHYNLLFSIRLQPDFNLNKAMN